MARKSGKQDGNEPVLKPITLPNDQPIDPELGKDDQLNFTPLARTLAGIAIGTEGPFTIGITAKWGYGKTSMLKLVQSLVHEHGKVKGEEWQATHVTAWFNAWQYEREQEPVVPLLLTIKDAIDTNAREHEAWWKGPAAKAWDKLHRLPAAVGAVASGLKLKAEVSTPIWVQLLTGLSGKVGTEYDVDRARAALKEVFESKEVALFAESDLLVAIRELNRISADLQSEGDGRSPEDQPKLVVFIDDLDRCHPDSAVKLLDGIKLILNQPGFIFVLALDKTIVEEYLVRRYRREYGTSDCKAAGQRYTDKIVQLEVPLPPPAGRFGVSSAEERECSDWQPKGFLEQVSHAILGEFYSHDVPDMLALCSLLSPRDVTRHLLRVRWALDVWAANGRSEVTITLTAKEKRPKGARANEVKESRPATASELASAATLARLIEVAFAASERQDFEDLCLSQSNCDLVRELCGLTPLPEGESFEAKFGPSAKLSTVPRSIVRAVTGPRGLLDAVRKYGRSWLTAASLRTHLLAYQSAPEAPATGPTDQELLVREYIRRELGLREEEWTDEAWREVQELHLPRELNGEGLDVVARSSSLQRLHVQGAQVSDLSPLSKLPELQVLEVQGTQVSSLSPLKELTSLQTVDARSTPVKDLSPLKELTSLQTLDVGRTPVKDLSPLNGLTGLQALNVSGTQVTDLSPLSGLTSLRKLKVQGTQVSDLSPLSKLPGLQVLEVQGTRVSDLSPLSGLTRLLRLEVQGTRVSDLSPLSGLTRLGWLDVSGTQVSDLSPLSELTSLEWLDVQGTKVTEEQVVDLRMAIPGCHILGPDASADVEEGDGTTS